MKKKFLVIRFSSIGDIVLTSPVLRCLFKQCKDAEIHFVTKQKHFSVVASNPYIHKIHLLKENFRQLIGDLEKEKFDYVIDLHQNFRSNRIKRNLNAKSFSFEKLNFKKFLLIRFKINRMPSNHIVDRYLDTLSSFGVQNDGEGLDFFIPADHEFNMERLPLDFRNGYIAFVIAGTYITKKLPAQKVAEICSMARRPVILLGGKGEMETSARIVSMSKGHILDFCGKISLHESATLIKNARVVLTNDTGLMHIAAAFHKKIYSFWGNTVPEFGMVPYQAAAGSYIAEVHGLSCRPCSKLGFPQCPKKHFTCMKEQDTGKAVEWIKQNF